MKEYIGEEFRKPYCEALAKGDVEWELWINNQWFGLTSKPDFELGRVFRLKPAPKRMVTMYDAQGKPHQLVAPEQEQPKCSCFYIDSQGVVGGLKPSLMQPWLLQLLEAGNIFITQEDAQAMSDFQRKQRLGEV